MPEPPADLTPAEAMPGRLTADGTSVPETYPAAVAAAATGSPADRAAALEGMAHAATLPLAEHADPGLPHCQRCEVLPEPLTGPGTLLLNLPHTHTLGKVLTWLVGSRWGHCRRGGVVSVTVGRGELAALLAPLLDRLSGTERRDARALFQPAGEAVQTADYFRVDDLDGFAARVAGGWLLELLRADRLTSHFQPILTADGASVYGYECLLRADADGRLVPPGPMFDVARRADLLFQLDLAARRAALKSAARFAVPGKVFVNFTPNAIYDAESCLDSTLRLVDDLGLGSARVVFEIVETERLPDLAHLTQIVGYYRRHGFEVALDDLGSGHSSLHLLTALTPDYVKLDMALTRGVDADPAKAVLAAKLLEATRGLGLRTVAEGVETAGEWAWVRGHGADFVQGFLFARPGSPPPEPNRP